MAAAAMHLRGPRLIRHIFSRLFFSVTYQVLLDGKAREREKEKERQRQRAKMTSLLRIKVPMLQAAHAITTCRRVDFLEGGGGEVAIVCTNPPKITQPWVTVLWNLPLTTTNVFLSRASLHPALP